MQVATGSDRDMAVLIVEDEGLMRLALRQFVQAEMPGCRIREAADGAQAIEQCVMHRPRVVLMDVRLPDTDGITLTAGIRKMMPDTQVIIVSTLVGEPYLERAKEAGAMGYVAKEHIYRDLMPQIRRAFEDGDNPAF
jgi:DNA-binding NarL/FixJ family response regulator